jgi:hypothetical protein
MIRASLHRPLVEDAIAVISAEEPRRGKLRSFRGPAVRDLQLADRRSGRVALPCALIRRASAAARRLPSLQPPFLYWFRAPLACPLSGTVHMYTVWLPTVTVCSGFQSPMS